MGKLFDRINRIGDYSIPIEKYLKDRRFYEDTMNPRFMNGYGYNDLTIGKPCLEYNISTCDGEYLSIFINEIDIYYEVETPWRSYSCSGRYEPSNFPNVEDIDELLDEIIKIVLN